uniref:Putative ovule protein n=1 Tax=Solanum chacoense TaxID=4108 RepID=A0A0V0H1P1_SOLCH
MLCFPTSCLSVQHERPGKYVFYRWILSILISSFAPPPSPPNNIKKKLSYDNGEILAKGGKS